MVQIQVHWFIHNKLDFQQIYRRQDAGHLGHGLDVEATVRLMVHYEGDGGAASREDLVQIVGGVEDDGRVQVHRLAVVPEAAGDRRPDLLRQLVQLVADRVPAAPVGRQHLRGGRLAATLVHHVVA